MAKYTFILKKNDRDSFSVNKFSMQQIMNALINEDSNNWCCNSPIEIDTLAYHMNKVSQICSLTQFYVNHSFRVTYANILTENRYFAVVPIMSVSCDKSVSSLEIYTRSSDKTNL